MHLAHWGWVTYICTSKLTIIGSDNGLSPGQYQAIIWTNAGILLIGPFRTNFSEILIKIYIFSFKKMHLKMSSGNWQPFCLGLNVLSVVYVFPSTHPHSKKVNSQTIHCLNQWWSNSQTHIRIIRPQCVNTLRLRKNGRHFADDTFKHIFLNENVRISIKISLQFVSKSPIKNIPTLVQIMAWHRPGDKPLSEPMIVRLPTRICVTRPQWVNDTIESNFFL